MPVITKDYVEGDDKWLPIEYNDYWDIPRCFYVVYKGIHLVFDAPFLEIQDEYSWIYIVYMNKETVKDWKAEYSKWKVGSIEGYERITFDETRRRFIHEDCLDLIFKNYEWSK
jgi:hypothetical protein